MAFFNWFKKDKKEKENQDDLQEHIENIEEKELDFDKNLDYKNKDGAKQNFEHDAKTYINNTKNEVENSNTSDNIDENELSLNDSDVIKNTIDEDKLEKEIQQIKDELEAIANSEDIFKTNELNFTSEDPETLGYEEDTKDEEIDEKDYESYLKLDKIEEEKRIKEEIAQKDEQTDIKEQDIEENEATEKEKEPKVNFFQRIKQGLSKTRDSILVGVERALSSFNKIDEELFEELEEALIMADIGMDTSLFIIDKVRKIVKLEKITEVSEIKNVIVRVISQLMEEETSEFELKSPAVILVIGVNGVGKTTSIGKLTNYFKEQGKSVILAAADTFRAAAIDQLEIWGERNGVSVIKHQENSDPSAVIFDAIKASKSRNADILICDTAGRLHNKKNLMEELKKIHRIIEREYPAAQKEILLVLDATTGQNALQQAKLFSEVANITGLVLTKLDGTAKGGIIIAIKNELKIPVRFIGIGEGAQDLRPFDAKDFAAALFDEI